MGPHYEKEDLKSYFVARLLLEYFPLLISLPCLTCSQESCELSLKLYQCYKRLADIVQEKVEAGGRRPSTSGGGAMASKSNLSLQCVVHMLKALFE